MISKKTIITATLLVSSGLLMSFMSYAAEMQRSIYQLASENKRFDVFINLAEDAGMESELQNLDAATLFIPVNKSFDYLSDAQRNFIFGQEDIAALRKLIRHHVVYDKVNIYGIHQKHDEALPGNFDISTEDGVYYLDGVKVMTRAYEASNGVVYGIDGVLFPGAGK